MRGAPFFVTNPSGVKFLVRVVFKGDKYGREDCLTYDKDEPMVEFYDQTHADDPRFGPRGQFVSSYFLSTMIDEHPGMGIDLYGGVTSWYIDGENKADAIAYAQTLVAIVATKARADHE